MFQQVTGNISRTSHTNATARSEYTQERGKFDTPGDLEQQSAEAYVWTPTAAGQYLSPAICVIDPNQRDKMVLAYRFSLYLNNPVAQMVPFIADFQHDGTAANESIFAAGNTDKKVFIPEGEVALEGTDYLSIKGQGQILVDTSIDSATSGVVERGFSLGVAMRAANTTPIIVRGFFSLRLHAEDEIFFQPSK